MLCIELHKWTRCGPFRISPPLVLRRERAPHKVAVSVTENHLRFVSAFEHPQHASVLCKVSNNLLGQFVVSCAWLGHCSLRSRSPRKQHVAWRLTSTQRVHSHFNVVILQLVDPATHVATLTLSHETSIHFASSSSAWHNRNSPWRGCSSVSQPRKVTRTLLSNMRASWTQRVLQP